MVNIQYFDDNGTCVYTKRKRYQFPKTLQRECRFKKRSDEAFELHCFLFHKNEFHYRLCTCTLQKNPVARMENQAHLIKSIEDSYRHVEQSIRDRDFTIEKGENFVKAKVSI